MSRRSFLIEREHDLAELDELRTAAKDGAGAAALVEGPPGIGKTALLAAVAEAAGHAEMQVLRAVGGELEQDMPFAIVRQLFGPVLRSATDPFTGAAGIAAPVFQPAHHPTPVIGDVVHGLYWLSANLAEDTPLLLVVDDIHWTDEPSLRFLSHLSRRITDLPVLLLMAGRPGPTLDRLVDGVLGGVRPQSIRLRPLSEKGVSVLVRRDLAADAEPEFCRACAVATGGNPFLLAEAVTRLRADGTRPVAAEANRVEHLRPETITRSVLARIARRGSNAIRFARSLAVLGPAAQPRHVATLAGLTVDETVTLADGLARDAIVTADRPISYVHPLVRTAVYSDSNGLLRAAQHKQAARLLADDGVAAEEYAPHLLLTDPAADPWVVQALLTAAKTAIGRGAPEPAAAYLSRARDEPPDASLRAEVTAALGRALGMAGRVSEANVVLREAIELTGPLVERLELALELGNLNIQAGWAEETVTAMGLAREIAAGHEAELPVAMHTALAMSDIATMRPPEVWVPNLERFKDDQVIQSVVAFGAAGLGDRPYDEAAELATRSAAGELPARNAWILLNMASAALTITDRFTESLDLLDRGLDAVRALGHEPEFRYLAVLRSHSAWFAGRLLEAEADARGALTRIPGEPRDRYVPLAAAALVDVLVERGRLGEAEQVIEDYDIGGEQPPGTLIMHFVPVARARLRLVQGRPAEALADLLAAGKTLVAAGFTNPSFAEWRADAVRAHVALGQRDEAIGLAAENLRLARSFGAPRSIAMALRVSALIDRDVDLLAEAVGLLAGSGADLEHAHCLVAYGSALRRAGKRTQALEPLRKGLDLANRCGAEPVATTAMEEMRAAGARPRRAAMSGRDALTASELRVARMAAGDATNREIAQSLFVSTRTVEVHLTNTYRKLGIDSRLKLRDVDLGEG